MLFKVLGSLIKIFPFINAGIKEMGQGCAHLRSYSRISTKFVLSQEDQQANGES
jgi:hypothetical protein